MMRKISVRDSPGFGNKLIRAAKQRLTAAELLNEHRLWLDSTYLAGYAIECSLKAVLLANTPRGRQLQMMQEQFRGRLGHDFEHLMLRLKRINVSAPLPVRDALRSVNSWTPDLRYEAGLGNPELAEACLQAARALIKWAQEAA